jgi:hypothetical protein
MTKAKKTQSWAPGTLFAIPQRDGVCSIGQVIDIVMTNVVSCAFFDLRLPCNTTIGQVELSISKLIAVLSVTREKLDFGGWTVVGHQDVNIDRALWPNEEFRGQQWVGAKVYDASIAEELLDAYNGLVAWDDWHDPEYLDKLLASPDRKPKHLLYKKR